MIRLKLLGSVDLRDSEGREFRSVLAQPKRLALLAFLAAASPAGPHRRDTLLGLFWPELDQEHARNALSKAVHFLRRSLGEGTIVSRGAEELALDASAVWSDVRAFETALEANRVDEALELYRGDLLPSFFVPDATGFEQWLERERSRLRDRASAAARVLAERHEAGRHLTLAVAAARRAVELSSGDERPLRRLIELLERLGDRAGAVRAYEEFARRLATELDVEPATETVALIERVKSSPLPHHDHRPVTSDSHSSEPAIARLAKAVAGRYKVERQLGAGAMALVALAHDLRHHRRVAIKVLRPELSALMGPERFLREIDIAASLVHPHILPLHDSGEADGLLYYVMPYVDGESLRGRLEREGQLPLADALQIAREVADALAYAHHRGFIHRDIKPENILLGVGHALVADFGIARAVDSIAGDQLATHGPGTGTPAYMSPEQMTGECPVDERTDIYALGCVLYEMLAGEPPFKPTTPEDGIAERLTRALRPVRTVRREASPELDAAIAKALARAPADRFAKVSDLAAAVASPAHAISSAPSPTPAKPGVSHPRRWRRHVMAASAVFLVLFGGTWALRPEPRTGSAADPGSSALVVLPFSVTPGDSVLDGLDEGMVDLVSTRLGAGAQDRVVDPRPTLAAWHRTTRRYQGSPTRSATLKVAASLGGTRAITGSIATEGRNVTLVASLLSIQGGDVLSRATVTGDADSLTRLVDRLTAKLLDLDAGEAEHGVARLMTTSLPALRAYLQGRSASRRFLFDQAREKFAEALQIDSTFALAALGLHSSSFWGHTRFSPAELDRAARLAWNYRDRLNARDELRVRAELGARYPEWTPPREQIEFIESVIGLVPDDPELWRLLGFELFHGGRHLGIPRWEERSSAALHRAIELDSSFLAPRNHLVRLSVAKSDTATLQDLTRYYTASASPVAAEMIQWLAYAMLGNRLAAELRPRPLHAFTDQSLRRVVTEGQSFGFGLGDAERALSILFQRGVVKGERERHLLMLREFALNRGRPSESLRAMNELKRGTTDPAFRQERLREQVYYALYWDGDKAAGEGAARELARATEKPAGGAPDKRVEQLRARCVLEQWRLAQGDRRTARTSIELFHGAAQSLASPREAARVRACAALLEAMLASRDTPGDALRAVDRLDSLHTAALPDLRNEDIWFCAGNLVSARLRAAHGDRHGALATLKRRGEPGDEKILLSSYLREEARLAQLTGDRAAALLAYRHYLALRPNPEPSLVPQRDSVRHELKSLETSAVPVSLVR